METIKSLFLIVVVVAVCVGTVTGLRKLWRRHEVVGRFDQFRDALEVNDLRELYKFIPPAVQHAMPYETFEKELLDAKNSIRVRDVTLDKVETKKDPRRPRQQVTFTITQEELKTGKKTQIQLGYDWIKEKGDWYVSISSIRERYGQYMGDDSRFGRTRD